ncbi:MAG: hypothetical protein ACYC2K_08765 [Gemmatimonadales bacterium]
MRRRWLLLMVALSGCSAAAADHERLGDQAYREGQFARALSEYQAAQRSGARSRVWAKAGSAALNAGDFVAATEAYAALVRDDPTRAIEGAVGLERAAAGAQQQGGGPAMGQALLALRQVAPGRPLGRLALGPVESSGDPAAELHLLPSVMAMASGPRVIDGLLLRYADAQRSTVACEAAARSYQTLLRRTSEARLRTAAQEGLGQCALLLGQDALIAGDGFVAERWFDLVVRLESVDARGLEAQIGLGDARVLQGDALGAAVAYQAVLAAPAGSDSLRQVATSKLNSLGAGSPPPTDGDV